MCAVPGNGWTRWTVFRPHKRSPGKWPSDVSSVHKISTNLQPLAAARPDPSMTLLLAFGVGSVNATWYCVVGGQGVNLLAEEAARLALADIAASPNHFTANAQVDGGTTRPPPDFHWPETTFISGTITAEQVRQWAISSPSWNLDPSSMHNGTLAEIGVGGNRVGPVDAVKIMVGHHGAEVEFFIIPDPKTRRTCALSPICRVR